MKNTKKLLGVLLVALLALTLLGCGTTKTFIVSVPDLDGEGVEMVSIPQEITTLSHNPNVDAQTTEIEITVKKYGDFPLVVRYDEDHVISFTVSYTKEGVTISEQEPFSDITVVEKAKK